VGTLSGSRHFCDDASGADRPVWQLVTVTTETSAATAEPQRMPLTHQAYAMMVAVNRKSTPSRLRCNNTFRLLGGASIVKVGMLRLLQIYFAATKRPATRRGAA
jgi:hypothetical protein